MFGLNRKNKAFGLDLSDLSVKIAMLKKGYFGFNLACFSRKEIPAGIIEEGEIKDEQKLIKIINDALQNTKGGSLKTRYCVASLPETEAFVRIIQLPRMKDEEMQEAVKWETENNIPMSIEEVYIDWQIIKAEHEKKDHYDILIGVMPKKIIDSYFSLFKKIRLRPLVFEIESVATARALIKNNLAIPPAMIIDLGAKRTSFIAVAGSAIPFTASIPISNISMIQLISQKLGISEKEAFDLKIKYGLNKAKGDGKVYEVLKNPLLEIVEKAREYLYFYNSHVLKKHSLKTGPIDKIMLCGGGANLLGLTSFLSQELKIKVEIGNPWVNIFKSQIKEVPELSFEQSIAYTTALGLALRGIYD